MSKILKTNVIPIEYNNRTEKKAKRIKRILEQNPLFFSGIFIFSKYHQLY